jgi:hypothetical protein
MPPGRRLLRALALPAVCVLLTAGCSGTAEDVDPDQLDAVEAPNIGACRDLTPEDVAEPSNATRTLDCAKPHTAETFAVGTLPEQFADAAYDDRGLGLVAYRACGAAFQSFLGADESLVMRTVVSWAWFRPSEKAWEEGARWYRCDVVGGGEQSKEYVDLPETAKGLLLGRPHDRWMVCAQGPTVSGAVKVPCTQKHSWRAVTTIKVGLDDEAYPGDRRVEVISDDYCSDSVGAWMDYPVDYEYAYTWFHEAEWEAGNRRSVCWAKTSK